MKILFTNWINVIGIFITIFMYYFISGLVIDDGVKRNIFQAIFSSLIGIIFYGLIYWVIFLILIIILDLILIIPNKNKIKINLIIEYIIISLLLIIWAIIYEERIWIYGVFIIFIITFFITQLIREKYIKRILNQNN